jgi:pyruvate formate lyase activating enzyme
MTDCKICGKEGIIADNFGVCVDCIKENRNNILDEIKKVHRKSRLEFSLEPEVPKGSGPKCKICVNECRVGIGASGFCGLRINESGKIIHIAGTKDKGILKWYFDQLPTNCVASWVCEGSEQHGKKNLAVFYEACSFNCLFCQNWHFKEMNTDKIRKLGIEGHLTSAEQLASKVDYNTFCICYFGGDPTVQMPHALATSKIIKKNNKDVRICFETNGSMNRGLLKKAIELCLESGGCIKFDLKAFNENLHYALCGVSNKRTYENFEFAGSYFNKRKETPLLVASTLLIPGYVTEDEVYNIASFIASIDKRIPYSLLAFYPHFYMNDLPITSRTHAIKALDAAKNAGLSRVHLGNIHLLGY